MTSSNAQTLDKKKHSDLVVTLRIKGFHRKTDKLVKNWSESSILNAIVDKLEQDYYDKKIKMRKLSWKRKVRVLKVESNIKAPKRKVSSAHRKVRCATFPSKKCSCALKSTSNELFKCSLKQHSSTRYII